MQGIYTLQICKPSTVGSSLRQGKGSQHDLSVVTIYSLQLNDMQALATGQYLYRKAYNTTGPFQKLLLD